MSCLHSGRELAIYYDIINDGTDSSDYESNFGMLIQTDDTLTPKPNCLFKFLYRLII